MTPPSSESFEPLVLEAKDLLKMLPHRYPMILLDRVTELEAGHRAVGIKCVTYNEPFFRGHFPDDPIMPGIFIVEACAQLTAVIMSVGAEKKAHQEYLASIERFKFLKPVCPGDVLQLESTIDSHSLKLGLIMAKVSARVGGSLVATGSIIVTARNDERQHT